MKNLLRRLCSLPCVTGDEPQYENEIRALLSPLGEVQFLPNGTALCFLPKAGENLPTVMLEAHLDRIGLMVTRVSPRGFVHAAQAGGADPRTLAASRVTIYTKSGPIPGVICSTPPHLATGDELPDTGDIAIDVGMSEERAKALVSPGDRITFDGEFTELLGDRVCAPGLDNRAGCAAVLHALELLHECGTANIVLALCSQEEVGGGGARTAANAVAPDFCFAVDVTFGETPDSSPNEVLRIGGGPAIGFSPALDRRLCALMRETAESNGIPWQAEVMSRTTGTDADSIAPSGRGVRTALLSVPERYMHTAGEVAAICDIENTARLIALTVGGGKLQ